MGNKGGNGSVSSEFLPKHKRKSNPVSGEDRLFNLDDLLGVSPYVMESRPVYQTPRVGVDGKIDRNAPILAVVVRELDAADALLIDRMVTPSRPSIAVLRDSHHRVARMLAKGIDPVVISTATGYAVNRVKELARDMSMRELVSHYEKMIDEVAVDFKQRYETLMANSTGMLLERMEAEPETFNNQMLLEITTTLGDRTGMAPTSKIESKHTVGIVDAGTISEIKKAVDGRMNGKVINGTCREVQELPRETGSENIGTGMGATEPDRALQGEARDEPSPEEGKAVRETGLEEFEEDPVPSGSQAPCGAMA